MERKEFFNLLVSEERTTILTVASGPEPEDMVMLVPTCYNETTLALSWLKFTSIPYIANAC